MGRLNTEKEHRLTLKWACNYCGNKYRSQRVQTLKDLNGLFQDDLKKYFALAGLAHSKSAKKKVVAQARSLVFHLRVSLEQSIIKILKESIGNDGLRETWLKSGKIFGRSYKQGVSLRMPLSSCMPTNLCSNDCYAHDVLDASPASVIRGALNGYFAQVYEESSKTIRKKIIDGIRPHISGAIKDAKNEVRRVCNESWNRQPRIRFAHVGEIAAFPAFANTVASEVKRLSDDSAICTVYTRHKKAVKLNPLLWVVNFTLDEDSQHRLSWAPKGARMVFSAFGGRVSKDVKTNFLEHHRWSHLPAIGEGNVCPATLPETKNRNCDSLRCDLCFR